MRVGGIMLAVVLVAVSVMVLGLSLRHSGDYRIAWSVVSVELSALGWIVVRLLPKKKS